jgi:hypothetical protein
MCSLGLLGIILMIIANEITFNHIDHRDTILSWIIKFVITISTIILLGFIIYYHRLDLKLYSVNNSLADWRIGITSMKLFLILLEVSICAIHPIPRSFPSSRNSVLEERSSNSSTPHSLSYISTDVALGIPSKYKYLFLK